MARIVGKAILTIDIEIEDGDWADYELEEMFNEAVANEFAFGNGDYDWHLEEDDD